MGESVRRKMGRPRIVILGAGNVATHLAVRLAELPVRLSIWSRSDAGLEALLLKAPDAGAIRSLDEVPLDADIYIISVPDSAIAGVADALPKVSGTVAHTSGSIPMEVLSDAGHKRVGVVYPLQTFSKDNAVDVKGVRFFVEGNCSESTKSVTDFALELCGRPEYVHYADSAMRAELHLGAVFACNFVNRMLQVADERMRKNGLDLSVYAPLISETVAKAFAVSPEKAATGPAVRRDFGVMRSQLAKLSGAEAEAYIVMSALIMNIPLEECRKKLTES